VKGIYDLRGNSYVMNGELNTNDATLNNRFAIYSTPGNAVIYIDYVRANTDATITSEKGGLMAVSVDEFTKTSRTVYGDGGKSYTVDGSNLTVFKSSYANFDNCFGIVAPGNKDFAFGDRTNNNSIMTAKCYASYSNQSRTVKKDETADRRAIIYYTGVDSDETCLLANQAQQLSTEEGWNGAIAFDAADKAYMLLSNFAGTRQCRLSGIRTHLGAPVFTVKTMIGKDGASADFEVEENHSAVNCLHLFIEGDNIEAIQAEGDSTAIFLTNLKKKKNTITINAVDAGASMTKKLTIGQKTLKAYIRKGELLIEEQRRNTRQ
jgi:hypothetical protein